MLQKNEKTNGGIPFHLDDNKYNKTPLSFSKTQSRVRFRKRHAVIAFCLLAMTFVIVKTNVAPSSSHKSRGVYVSFPQTAAKAATAQQTTIVQSEEEIAAAAAAAAAARAEERRRLRKKKKNPPTLFDFMDVKKGKNDKKKNNNNKKKSPPSPWNSVPDYDPEQVTPPQKPAEPVSDEEDEQKENGNTGNVKHPTEQPRPGTSGSNNNIVNHNNTPLWESRKNRVKGAFQEAWAAYRRDAWGKDEYHPVGKYGTNMITNGQGFTIVDSLDTILLMGLENEYQEAKAWVRDELTFDQDGEVNLFETTIRVLGGLLSAYDQSGKDPLFLTKAVDLADRLLGAFDTPSGIPFASVHLKEKRGVPSHDRGISSTSEVATLQLEFKYLSYLTNDSKYWKAAENVMLKLRQLEGLDGLVPIYIDPYTGAYYGSEIRLGSRGDSYYEYLVKQYLQTGKTEQVYRDMYDDAMAGVKKHLLGRTMAKNLLYVGEISKTSPEILSPKMDHLVCFLGGTMALASTDGHAITSRSNPRYNFTPLQETDFKIGEELTKSCYEMYRQTETGLAPEIVHWVHKLDQTTDKTPLQYTPGADLYIEDRDAHNWLRPETVESLFYMWRLTGDEQYRHWGWNIFEAIERYSKVPTGGFSSIRDVRRQNNVQFSDKMETFFLAETLKYLYLLFGPDDVLPLDKYVFNTEAHPLPIFNAPSHLLTRTAGLRGAKPSVEEQKEQESAEAGKENGADSTEDQRYRDLLKQEDNNAAQAGSDEDEEEDSVQPADEDDDHSAADDSDDHSHLEGEHPSNHDQDLEDEEDETLEHDAVYVDGVEQDAAEDESDDKDAVFVDGEKQDPAEDEEDDQGPVYNDEVEQDPEEDETNDQGPVYVDGVEQDPAEHGSDDGVSEVEVEYEDETADEQEAGNENEDEEEDDGEEDEPEDDEDGELGVEGEEEEEEEEEEPVAADEGNDEADEFEAGGENFGVVNLDDWEGEEGEEGEEGDAEKGQEEDEKDLL
ncbi:mannosyl-oligosaccharide alpha-1,2-mannosidase [Podila epigama]|nr:mannosyl-oligosaccharide alpha-1,2-mannosidase [Podila epigama]